MSAGHTPGLLKVTYREFSKIKAENGALVATCNKLDGLANVEANAKRLAACWNKFDGMTTSDIEAMSVSVGSFRDFAEEALSQHDGLTTECDKLKTLNAELLEVMREVDEKNTEALNAMAADGVTPPAWFVEQGEKIKAVIAKATGASHG